MQKNKKEAKLQQGIHLHQIVKGSKKLWYWQMLSRNGRMLVCSSKFKSKQWAIRNIIMVAGHFDNNQHYFDHSKPGIALSIYSI